MDTFEKISDCQSKNPHHSGFSIGAWNGHIYSPKHFMLESFVVDCVL